MESSEAMQLGHLPTEAELVKAFLRNCEPVALSEAEIAELKGRITALLRERDAVLVAHYYTSPLVQALAEETGGFVSDSLQMARFGHDHPTTSTRQAALSSAAQWVIPVLPAGRSLSTATAVGSHGGGAFSGKDPTKVDRSGAYISRHIAKNIVAAGIADKVEVQLAYAIGVPEPVSILIETRLRPERSRKRR